MLGILPWKLVFQDNSFLQTLYYLYSKTLLIITVIFITTEWMEVCRILNQDPVNLTDLNNAIAPVLLFTVTAIRMIIFNRNPDFMKLLNYIINRQEFMAQRDDEVDLSNSKETIDTHLYNYYRSENLHKNL